MADLSALLRLGARFGLAGMVTTAVGFAVIAVLDVGLHVAPPLANAAGYVVGVPLGFVLNRSFVFAHGGSVTRTGLKYLSVVAAAWALNQLVLMAVGRMLGETAFEHLAAQLAGMVTYTGVTFLACRFWVFDRPGGALPPR